MVEKSYLYKNANHIANLNDARLSGKLCDVTIKVNDKEFRAHKIILAANLRYFKSMFLNTFQESKQDVVTMQDVDETCMEAFISFAYTGEILLTDSNALGLLEVANYLAEDGIKESCIEFLKIHLKKDDAFWAYKLANSIGTVALQNVAKQTILANFEDCSLKTEFFDLDFESLKGILSGVRQNFSESQQLFFEGVMRWILQNIKDRRPYINDLLDFIDIIGLEANNYLLGYFCERIKEQRDVMEDIMTYYHEKSRQAKKRPIENLRSKLWIIGSLSPTSNDMYTQYYDFKKKQWSSSKEILNHSKNIIDRGILLENKLYYTVHGDAQKSLHVFDPTANNVNLLTENRLLRLSALATCSRFLYLCGGLINGIMPSNQILRYDSQDNSFEKLPSMETGRYGAAAIFYQSCIYIFGGYNGVFLNSVERYDPNSKKYTVFPSMCEARYGLAVAVLNEKLYACGGCNNSVEVYDPANNRWQLVSSMKEARCHFLLVAYQGKLFAIGGDGKKTVEVYDPLKNKWQVDEEMSSKLQIKYPQGGWTTSNCEN